MDIALPVRTSRTATIATLAVFVLGLALSFSTWRNLRQQQTALYEHAVVTARSIATGIEISIHRELRPHGPDLLPAPQSVRRAIPRTVLQDYTKRTDARFIGLFNPQGHILLSSHTDPKSIQSQLSSIVWEDVGRVGEWSGEMLFEGQPIMVLGKLSPLAMGAECPDGQCDPAMQPPLLLVGVDMAQYTLAFQKYRRTAVLQTGYILAVTIVFWILLMGFVQHSEHKQRLDRLESFNARLLDTMPDGLITVDAQGLVVAANPAAMSLLGGESFVGQSVTQVVAPLGVTTLDPQSQDWVTLKTRGKHLEMFQVPLKDASGQVLLLMRDRTELVGLEQALHRNEKLAAIGRLAAGMAHEIRNPLSALRGFAQFFSKKFAGQEPEELYARTMVQEADRLNRVITDLLFLARPRQLALARVPVADVLAEVGALLAMDVQARQCVLRMKSGPDLWADRDAFKQVLINLVMNALAAVPEAGGEIIVSSQAEERGVCVVVQDNGRGMSAQEQEHALEPFFTTRDHGTGLGLAIVHTIMHDHGGDVRIESVAGQGTTVSLMFPHAQSE